MTNLFDYSTLNSVPPYTGQTDYSSLSVNTSDKILASQSAEAQNVIAEMKKREQSAFVVNLTTSGVQSGLANSLAGAVPSINQAVNGNKLNPNSIMQSARAGPLAQLSGGASNINQMFGGGMFTNANPSQNSQITAYQNASAVPSPTQAGSGNPINVNAVMQGVQGGPLSQLTGGGTGINTLLESGGVNIIG